MSRPGRPKGELLPPGGTARSAKGAPVNHGVKPMATLDHLVLAATSLADGIDYVASLTGATPQPGGKHVAMGTHNALLRVGPRLYLAIIATDPAGVVPARPRWFNSATSRSRN